MEDDKLTPNRFIWDNLNLKKKYPNYINQWVFQIAWFGILILALFAVKSNDWQVMNYFAWCPESSKEACRNPFYTCQSMDEYWQKDQLCFTPNHPCPSKYTDLCTKDYIMPGEMIGEIPSSLFKNLKWYVLLIVGLALIVNHLVYIFIKRYGN